MEILRFALLGLATGGIYALLAQGITLIYRGSGLLNFAQGALAMAGAYAYYQMTVHWQVPRPVAALIAVAGAALAGALFHLVILRAMRRRNASSLSKVIATLGLLLVLQSAAPILFGSESQRVPSLLPTGTVHVFSDDLPITADRLWILGIAILVTAALTAIYKRTQFGRVTTAVAENELAAATLGYSPNIVAAANWAIGSGLAALGGILIAPIVFLEPVSMVLLVIPAMAVALVGRFSSFPIVLATALGLGVAQSELSRYVSQPGWATGAPFIVVIVVLALRGQALPLRSFVLDKLPAVGNGRPRPIIVVVALALAALATSELDPTWDTAIVTTCGMSIICLSIVLLTGYTGQLSLAQFVMAGVGAFAAARLSEHMSFVPSLAIAVLITGAVGALLGLPALRTRGTALAVATLCLGSGLVAVGFNNADWNGGLSGILIASPSIFGWSIDPFLEPGRYAFVVFTTMVAIAVALTNLRRSRTGRRLLAVRSNERAAASLGVGVPSAKVYAFFMAAAIAGIGGVLLAFAQPTLQLTTFDVFTCILLVGATVTVGVGYVMGGVLGGTLIAGGVVTQLLSGWSDAGLYMPLLGAVILLVTLVTAPDGAVGVARAATAPAVRRIDVLTGRVSAKVRESAPWQHTQPAADDRHFVVPARGLQVTDLSVSFGGVHAVRDVSFDIRPGEIHGLIGPNGAGKTTVIDAITGFASTSSGSVTLDDRDITKWSPRRRSAVGVARSFQSLELFDDLTIEENIAVGCDRHRWWRYLTDLIVPGRITLTAPAVAAIRGFELADLLQATPASASFGQRKLVAIARSVAQGPSVLLLDEPAAGLDDAEAEELATVIRQLARDWGIGVLLVEHKVGMIMSLCDRITVLQGGKVLASGDPADVRAVPEVRDAYLGRKADDTDEATRQLAVQARGDAR